MVSMLTLSAVYCGFEPWLGQTKDYNIDICSLSFKYKALRRKSKDWLARNQNNVSEWGDMSIHRLLFQWASTIKIQLSVLV
jgi:predicted LPLAT superfamily acyltransferase